MLGRVDSRTIRQFSFQCKVKHCLKSSLMNQPELFIHFEIHLSGGLRHGLKNPLLEMLTLRYILNEFANRRPVE